MPGGGGRPEAWAERGRRPRSLFFIEKILEYQELCMYVLLNYILHMRLYEGRAQEHYTALEENGLISCLCK